MRLQAALGSRSRSPRYHLVACLLSLCMTHSTFCDNGRWSVAFKYAGQVAETTLIDIDIQV